MVMKVEKSALLGKPSICFILKKNPKYISFHSAFHPVPQRKEVRKLTAYLVNGRLPDLLSTPPGGGSYSSHLAGKHTPVSLSPPGRPPPCQHLLPPPPGIISTSQHRFPDCFTSCCQEFSTLRLTSTPCFHVLCCCFFFFFQVYSPHTAAENGYKSGEWLRALQGGREGVPALPLHHVISDTGKPLLKQ